MLAGWPQTSHLQPVEIHRLVFTALKTFMVVASPDWLSREWCKRETLALCGFQDSCDAMGLFGFLHVWDQSQVSWFIPQDKGPGAPVYPLCVCDLRGLAAPPHRPWLHVSLHFAHCPCYFSSQLFWFLLLNGLGGFQLCSLHRILSWARNMHAQFQLGWSFIMKLKTPENKITQIVLNNEIIVERRSFPKS